MTKKNIVLLCSIVVFILLARSFYVILSDRDVLEVSDWLGLTTVLVQVQCVVK